MTTSRRSELSASELILFLTLTMITTFPIFYFDVLPLLDLPSHIARMTVIQSMGEDPVLAQYYELNWHLVPNLALDMWALITAPLMDAEMSSRWFIALSFVLITSGTIFVHRALGGTGYWPFISFVFIWNEILAYGFLSFLFSIGLALWFFGFWIRYRGNNIMVRVALHSVLVIFLLVCHLFGFALYAVAVGAYEAGRLVLNWRVRGIRMPETEFIGGAVQFIPALIVFLFSQTSSGASVIEYHGLIHKISDYSSPILLYSPPLQLIVVSLFVLMLAHILWRKWASIQSACWFIIVVGAACTIIAPSMMFDSHFLSHRMPVAFSFLFLATVQFKEFNYSISHRFRTGLICAVTALTMFVSWYWAGYQQTYKDLFEVTETIEEGSSILSMTLGATSYSGNLRPPLQRAVEYLVPKKKIFSPHILANAWHQPIRLTEHAQQLRDSATNYQFSPNSKRKQELLNALDHTEFEKFDYVLTIRLNDFEDRFPANWVLRREVGLFRLYQAGHPKIPAAQ